MLPNNNESSDVIVTSKNLQLLRHEGIAFNLDLKKQILRDIETHKKTQIRGNNSKYEISQNMVRNFKEIYE